MKSGITYAPYGADLEYLFAKISYSLKALYSIGLNAGTCPDPTVLSSDDLFQVANYFRRITAEDARDGKKTVWVTGVGKSSFVAQYVVSIANLAGFNFQYLDTTRALHGDLAVVDSTDSLLIFSKSGATQELIDLVTTLSSKFKRVVSNILVTNTPDSPLSNYSTKTLFIPMIRELDKWNIIPTISVIIQMFIGQLIVLAMVEFEEGRTKEDFVKHHPGGTFGKEN